METFEKVHKSKMIDKVKFTDDGEGVIINWTETIMTEAYDKDAPEVLISEDKNHIKRIHESDFRPHKDFVDAMKMLRKPVIDITEIGGGDYKQFDKIRIYGLSFSGEQEEAKVVITFGKEVEWSGQVWTSNTPPTPLADNEKFKSSKQLDKFCKNVVDEAWKYIDGKHAENPQLSLSFADDSNMKLDVKGGE